MNFISAAVSEKRTAVYFIDTWLTKIVILVLLTLPSAALASWQLCIETLTYGEDYSLDEILDNVPAIHAFRVIPPQGELIAAPFSFYNGVGGPQSPNFRTTVHWALGSLMSSHQGNDHENALGAVIVRLRRLVESNQLVNLNAYDTYQVGNFAIPQDAIVIIQKEHADKLQNVRNAIVFDPTQTTLRQTVEAAIKNNKLWSFELERNIAHGRGAAILNGLNVNSETFFADILNRWPNLGFGGHLDNHHGIASLFGVADQGLQALGKMFNERSSDFPNRSKVLFLKAVIRAALMKLDRLMDSDDFSAAAKSAYAEKRRMANQWLEEMQPPGRISNGLTWWLDRALVVNQVKLLVNFTASEVAAILAESPGLQASSEKSVFWAFYALQRSAQIGAERANAEKLPDLFESNLKKLWLANDKRRAALYELAKIMYWEMDTNRVNSAVYEQYAQHPEFIRVIWSHFRVRLDPTASKTELKKQLSAIKEQLSWWDRWWFEMQPLTIGKDNW